jgi:glycosyltransferase involved in cell wall biosynthesis
MKFSIIIPVRSFNDLLKESIKEIKKLQYADFEALIILDNAESFDFEGDTRFILVDSGPISPGEKRNIGAKKASGDVLVFLDDDAFPASDWLLEASKIFENPEVYALGGPAITPLEAPFLERMSGRILESWLASGGTVYRHIPTKERYINDYPTVNLFVRTSAFWAIGGFSKDFWPGEDTKLCLDLVKYYKKPFLYSPRPIVFHHRRNIFIPHLKQISRYGAHRGRFARIYPETSRLPMYFVPSLFVIGLLVGTPLSFINIGFFNLYLFFVLTYASALLLEGRKVFIKDSNFLALPVFLVGTFLTHIVYGVNFLIGFIRRPALKLKAVDRLTGNYIEG